MSFSLTPWSFHLNHSVVNTNSKYKEDDFTDSDAVACFKTCESFSVHMSISLFRPPTQPLYTSRPLSQIVTLEMITTLSQGATLAPSWWWYRYLASNRRCLHLAQLCSKSSKIIMHSRDYIIAQIQHDKTAISPPPYPKPGVSGNLLFQFLSICTTNMKFYKTPMMLLLLFVNNFLF